MKSLFKYLNYKDFLKSLLHAPEARGVQSQLAKHLGCQSAYIYQVLKGKGDLTEDQAFKVTTFLNMPALERDYFLLLVRYAKAGSAELRNFLKQELNQKSAEDLDLRNKADSSDPTTNALAWDYYFSSELPSYIHILTSSEAYQTAPALAKKLNADVAIVNDHLRELLRFGFVSHVGIKWLHASPSIHFSKASSHNTQLQLLRRSQCLHSIVRGEKAEDVHFSTLFTLDKESYDEIRTHIVKFIESLQKEIHKGGTDEMYVLSLDLFDPVS